MDGDSQTTYNVGIVEGGTSVNTIAQKATFLYEYRSDSYPCMEKMKAFFLSSLEDFQQTFPDGKIHVKEIGYRPCGNDVNQEKLMAMTNKVVSISEKYSGIPCYITSGSTDCNIPMSMGIPAISFGTYAGGGTHTREEWIEKDSLPKGMEIIIRVALQMA